MGFFGSDKKTSTVTTEIVETKDQRVQVGGSTGTLISPGATVGGAGAVSAAPYSTVQQSITSTGASPAEVQGLLDSVFEEGSRDRAMIGGLAESLGSGLREQSQQLGEIVAAAKAPEQTALATLMPLVLGLAVLMLWSK